MSSRRLVAVLVACLTSLGAISCGDDDPAPPEGGEDYALEVEAVTDAVSEEARSVLPTLNRFADGGVDAATVGEQLDRASDAVHDAAARLAELRPPEAASGAAADLGASITDLARALESAAIDARATDRGFSTPNLVGRAEARLVLAYDSGVGALSRAVRALAVAPTP